MNININKKEYRLLLDMLYLADWIMHAYAIKKEDYHHEHEVLRSKFLSYFKEMGAEDIIECPPELNGYYETKEFEDYAQDKFIQPYEDELFWDELIERLAKRDLIKSVGAKQYSKMELIERMTKIDELTKRYEEEFEKHGIENLDIK